MMMWPALELYLTIMPDGPSAVHLMTHTPQEKKSKGHTKPDVELAAPAAQQQQQQQQQGHDQQPEEQQQEYDMTGHKQAWA